MVLSRLHGHASDGTHAADSARSSVDELSPSAVSHDVEHGDVEVDVESPPPEPLHSSEYEDVGNDPALPKQLHKDVQPVTVPPLLDTLELASVLPVAGVAPISKKLQTKATPDDGSAQLEFKYALYGFAIHHFLLAPPRSRFSSLLRSAKPFDLETRLRWEKELHTSPLTSKLTGEQIRIGLQAFRNISGFMGNRASGKGQVDHCFKLLRNVMPRAVAIKDEIFCQLCKQLTGNPDATAARNGWLLLSACLVTFPPSATLAPFLEHFFADHVGCADPKAAQFAAACLASLHEWTTKGKSERKEIPSIVEIESLRDHTTVSVRVWFIDCSPLSFGVTSWTTCAELAETVAQRLGLVKKQAFSLFEVSPTGEERRADSNERVVDLLALWERLGVEKQPKKIKKANKLWKSKHSGDAVQVEPGQPTPPTHHHLLYKVFLHVPLDDDMVEDLELVYKQAVHDIVRGVVVSPLHECIQLAAYQLYVAHGPYSRTGSVDVHRELPICLPAHLVSASNRSEIAGRVQQAYEALSSSDGEDGADQVSAQQIRLAYLKVCGTLRLYGSTFFAVHNTRDRAMPPDLVLAVSHKGVAIVSVANEAVLHQFPYVSIATWGYSSNAFVFVVATHGAEAEEVEYVLKTKLGKAINDVVAAYVAFILACSTPKTS